MSSAIQLFLLGVTLKLIYHKKMHFLSYVRYCCLVAVASSWIVGMETTALPLFIMGTHSRPKFPFVQSSKQSTVLHSSRPRTQ